MARLGHLRWRYLLATALLLVPASIYRDLLAIPNTALNPHSHENPATTDGDTTWIVPDPATAEDAADPDPDDPDARMHQHRDDHDPRDGNGLYKGLDVWDDRNHRNRLDTETIFHGFINVKPRYKFSEVEGEDLSDDAKADFDRAVKEWERAVNGIEFNANGRPIRTRIGFDKVDEGAAEITVIFADDIGTDTAQAFWQRDEKVLKFRRKPRRKLTLEEAATQQLLECRQKDSGDALDENFEVEIDWTFGATARRQTDVTLECRRPGNAQTTEIDQRYVNSHFLTTARHEIGHAFGLDHFGEGLMRRDIDDFRKEIDDDAIHGLKDVYSIPHPDGRVTRADEVGNVFWMADEDSGFAQVFDVSPIQQTIPPFMTARFTWTNGRFEEAGEEGDEDDEAGDAESAAEHPNYGDWTAGISPEEQEVCFHRPEDETVTDWRLELVHVRGRTTVRGGNISRDSPWAFRPIRALKGVWLLPVLGPLDGQGQPAIHMAVNLDRLAKGRRKGKSHKWRLGQRVADRDRHIKGGRLPGLPGVYFATDPFTFDPQSETGWVPVNGDKGWLDGALFERQYGPIAVIGLIETGSGGCSAEADER